MSTPTTRRPRRRTGGRGGAEPRARIQAREDDAWTLAIRGYSQRDISTHLGISQPAVCKLLRRVGQRLDTQMVQDTAHHRALLHGRWQAVARASWEGWDRSHGDHTRKRQRRVDSGRAGEAPRQVTELTAESRAGDPRFLSVIADVTGAELHALGPLPAPPAAPPQDLADLTAEELAVFEQVAARRAAAAAAAGGDR